MPDLSRPTGVVVLSDVQPDQLGPDKVTYQQTVTAGPHTFPADAPNPPSKDSHPNPFDFLLSALGTCTSIWLLKTASDNKIPLKQVRVELHIHPPYAQALANNVKDENIIERTITLLGTLTSAQRKTLMDAARDTPVFHALTGKMDVSDHWP